jgi:NAD+ diphosphatase
VITGNPLNRLSFLRENYEFLRSTLPLSKYLLLKPTERYELNPLTKSDAELSFLDYSVVENNGIKGLYGGVNTDEEYLATYNSEEEEARPIVVFLGIDEANTESGWAWKEWKGQPYWALIWSKDETIWDEKVSQFREARNLKVGYRDGTYFFRARDVG